MQDLGKILVIAGLVIAMIGALLWSGRFPNWLGRLPGDVSYQNNGFGFYFPITTCVLISIAMSLLFWLLRK